VNNVILLRILGSHLTKNAAGRKGDRRQNFEKTVPHKNAV
jgi:hypothetical protein